MPHELSVSYINNVIYNDLVSEVGSWRISSNNNNNDGTVNLSTLKQVMIVADGGVLEVHVNERFAISTCIYQWFQASRNCSFVVRDAEGLDGGDVEFGDVQIWEGLFEAWRERTTTMTTEQ